MKIILALAALVAVAFAAVPSGDFRSEFDHALVRTSMEHMMKLEYRLMELTHQIAHVEQTKNHDEVKKIVEEIEMALVFINRLHQMMGHELKRTDLNILEQVHFESAQKMCEILTKDLKQAEARVKAIK